VRQHNQIGDMLCSLTLYKALKNKYPDSHITLVAAKTNYEIPFFDINPYIDSVIVFDKSSLKSILKFIRQLRSRKYQLGFVPSTIVLSRTSHIICRISGAKIRVGVKSIDGKENKSHKHLNLKADFDWKEKHQLIRNIEVAKLIGCNLSADEINSIKIDFNENDIAFAKEFISSNFPEQKRRIVAFHPGAGKQANIWDKNNFIELIKNLDLEFNNYVLLTSGWTDENIISQISKDLNLLNIEHKILHNAQINKLGAVLYLVDLYITNDTGTMHIAGYSGAKMISLFGPTNPQEWAPSGLAQLNIKSKDQDINSISVEEVYSFAKTFLNKNKNF
jgi:ADP-heptose:LPS heptosyltransferase